jgi:hypothetical protein
MTTKIVDMHGTYLRIGQSVRKVWRYFDMDKQGTYLSGEEIIPKKDLSEVVMDYGKDIYYKPYTFNLDGKGSLTIRFWVFKRQRSWKGEKEGAPKITSYLEGERSPRTVIIILNGQRHGYLDKSSVNEVVGSSLLADRLLMQIDCDDLSLSLKKELITSTRMRLRTGEHLDFIK